MKQRVLIAGFGQRGREWMAATGRRGSTRVTAVADPAPAARAEAERRGLPSYADLSDALERERPDVAVIASRAADHRACALQCVAAGVPALVEKPLAPSLAEAEEIATAAARAGVPVLAGQNFRFRRVELTVAAALARGAIGEPRNVVRVSARTARGEGGDPLAVARSALWEFSIHAIDQLVARFGGPPESVAGELLEGSEIFLLRLTWPGSLTVLYRHEDGAPLFHHYEFVRGADAGLSVEVERVTLFSVRHRPRRLRTIRPPSPERALLEELVRAAETGEPGPLGAEANLATIATVDAAARALGSAQPEAVRSPAS